jgi:cytochrome c553
MNAPIPVALILLVTTTSCSRFARHQGPSLDSMMVDIGRRFELAGRAATARRFELADFEANEIEGIFRYAVPDAQMPQGGAVAHIPAMARAFAETYPAALKRAAQAKDGRAFAEAFTGAAAGCNACHQASGRAFIQVPTLPGKSVPDLDLASSSAPTATPN